MNKRNDAMYRARQAYNDLLMYARVLQKGGDMSYHGGLRVWHDANGYAVVIQHGRIITASKQEDIKV